MWWKIHLIFILVLKSWCAFMNWLHNAILIKTFFDFSPYLTAIYPQRQSLTDILCIKEFGEKLEIKYKVSQSALIGLILQSSDGELDRLQRKSAIIMLLFWKTYFQLNLNCSNIFWKWTIKFLILSTYTQQLRETQTTNNKEILEILYYAT